MKTIAEQLRIKEFPFEILNKKGDRIYFEYSSGFWWRSEYNSQGKQTYFKNSEGCWWRREYDCQGNQIHLEESGGFWSKREFDSNGNIVYYENSSGYVEDNRVVPEYTMEELVKETGNFKLTCIDCDRLYEDFGLDVVLSDEQWELIHPDEKGVICAQCIVNRAEKIKDVVTVNLTLEFK